MSVPFRILHFDTVRERVDTIQDFGLRCRSLMGVYDATLVFINHMTTRFDGENALIVPSLGETWSNLVDLRLLFERDELEKEKRWMTVLKSDYEHLPQRPIRFEIHDKGINFF